MLLWMQGFFSGKQRACPDWDDVVPADAYVVSGTVHAVVSKDSKDLSIVTWNP